ncbi:hypothetical protein OAG76_02815, partial [Rubripirellula sp.]|nr:hypothetical protein [Rubripirellula sp.]
MRFASFLMLLLIPAFTLAQTRDSSHGVDALALPFAVVSEYSKSVQELTDESQLVGYPGARHEYFHHGHDGMLGVDASHSLDRVVPQSFVQQSFVQQSFVQQSFVPQSFVQQSFVPQYRFIDTPQAAAEISKNVHLRNHFDNSWVAFAGKKKGTVAFIGGSITEMNGYRVMVEEDLRRRFPGTDFTFVNAGISSTCST